jgi:hypothetical protein
MYSAMFLKGDHLETIESETREALVVALKDVNPRDVAWIKNDSITLEEEKWAILAEVRELRWESELADRRAKIVAEIEKLDTEQKDFEKIGDAAGMKLRAHELIAAGRTLAEIERFHREARDRKNRVNKT